MKKEKRQLTEKEKKRKVAFDKICKAKQKEGYKKIDLTATATEVYTKGYLIAILICLPISIAFFLKNEIEAPNGLEIFILVVLTFLSLIVHEGIHGFYWGLAAKNHFKSIEFGAIPEQGILYCTCREPLSKAAYLIGSIMPCLLLGIIPSVISVFTGDIMLLIFGVQAILCAAGDILIIILILKHKSNETTIFLDHPTEIGLVCFEKTKKRK